MLPILLAFLVSAFTGDALYCWRLWKGEATGRCSATVIEVVARIRLGYRESEQYPCAPYLVFREVCFMGEQGVFALAGGWDIATSPRRKARERGLCNSQVWAGRRRS